jgi:hypothetical protein
VRERDRRDNMVAEPAERARSLVIIAIWPSCVSAIGKASLTVSLSSVRHAEIRAGVMAAPAMVCPGMVWQFNEVTLRRSSLHRTYLTIMEKMRRFRI